MRGYLSRKLITFHQLPLRGWTVLNHAPTGMVDRDDELMNQRIIMTIIDNQPPFINARAVGIMLKKAKIGAYLIFLCYFCTLFVHVYNIVRA